MVEKKTVYYRVDKGKGRSPGQNKYQLLEFACDVPRVLGSFRQLRDLKKFVRTSFPTAELKKFSENHFQNGGSSPPGVERVYLSLRGKAVRELSWGMSRQKVARLEQIEGGEHLLMQKEIMYDFAVNVQFGFDEWANCGLEYIAYSSPEPAFPGVVEKELRHSYGGPERVVDYHNLDRLLKGEKIEAEETLIRFLREPESHAFNHFAAAAPGLTFRSALKWSTGRGACLLYTKGPGCRGERNRHNHAHVLEYWPEMLFDFYQEQFAVLYLHN